MVKDIRLDELLFNQGHFKVIIIIIFLNKTNRALK